MSESISSDRLERWSEEGLLDVAGGVITVFLAWFVIPVVGLLGAWFGYRLHARHDKTYGGVAVGALGILGVLIWLALLATT